jgi:hypothetical protein
MYTGRAEAIETMPRCADTACRTARMRFLRTAGLLLLCLFAFDIVDGSPPFTPHHAGQGASDGSGPDDAGGGDVSPDAEFFCARSLVVAPVLPADLGPPLEEGVGAPPEADPAGGFVPRPFHPPRPSRT